MVTKVPGQSRKWLEKVSNRKHNDRDTVLLITGNEREGKSTLAWRLARRLDPDFGPERMVFNANDFVRVATEVPRGSVICLDEAIEGGFSREAMGKHNKALVKFLIVCGERNHTAIICFPNINFIDKYVKGHRMHYWLYVQKRGLALVHKPLPTHYPGAKGWAKALFYMKYASAEDDPLWQEYLDRKAAMVQARADEESGAGADDFPNPFADMPPMDWKLLD